MKKSFIDLVNKFKYLKLAMVMTISSILVIVNSLNPLEAAADQTITDQNGDGIINLVDARILAPPQTVNCPVCVDANGDKEINEMDIGLIKYHAGLYAPKFETPTYRYHPRFDVNNDKTLDDNDVMVVQNYLGQTVVEPAFGLDNPSELGFGFKANEILITFSQGVSETEKEALFSKYNLARKFRLENLETDTVGSLENNIENLQKQIKTEPIVETVTKIHIGELSTNDPAWPDQWGPQKIRIEDVWRTETTGNNQVKVAVLDSGVDVSHPDLQSNISSTRYNAFDGTAVVTDQVGHGTSVASIIGATIDNSLDIAGLNGEVDLIPVKVCQPNEWGGYTVCTEDYVNLGLNWAILQGVDVINMSLCLFEGEGDPNSLIYQTLNLAAEKGINVFAGTGNSGVSNACFPANHPKVVAIGATNPDDSLWQFSNGGADFLAPGVDIVSTRGSGLYVGNGTSFATPHASGVAALCRAVVPVNTQSRNDLNCGRFEHNGYGRIDAWGSVWYKNCYKFDFNNNGYVGAADAQRLASRYNTSYGNPAYDVSYDITPVGVDGTIGLADALLILARTGLSCQAG